MACVISSPFSTSVGAVAGGGAGRTALRQAQNTRGVVQKCYGVAVAGANAGAATTRASAFSPSARLGGASGGGGGVSGVSVSCVVLCCVVFSN